MTKQQRSINTFIDAGLIAITAYGSFQNGWFTLSNLVSWLGVIGVIGLAKKWQGNFYFNMAQNVFNFIVSGQNRLFGDAIMAGYYFVTQIFGIKEWREHQDKDGKVITDKTMDWTVTLVAIVIGGIGLGIISWLLGGAFVILDAFNNSTAIVAQYLQVVKRKRSAWLLWGVTNLVGIVIWLGVGQPQMAVMYFVFALNSVRGYLNWGV